jgi:hypothetical protein
MNEFLSLLASTITLPADGAKGTMLNVRGIGFEFHLVNIILLVLWGTLILLLTQDGITICLLGKGS